MTKNLALITTQCKSMIENGEKRFHLIKNHDELYYDINYNKIVHFYYGHKILTVNLKEKLIGIPAVEYTKTKIIQKKLEYLFKFYEFLDAKRYMF